ncbi:hypothetical protein HC235_02170 [Pyrobaculum arsenaticum]|uniref:Uncharacterized protein n=1 Tax=Pyrobaculum arsenaticum TaxID=121277 RepID=A0A7L4P8L0_9CREN|nr:hypothetical protein [Pyrobaculum arsenaticum]
MLLMAALAILAISVAASRAGGAAFNTTFMYKNGVLEVVGPDGQPHALKLEMKGGGLKAVEIRLLPNGTLLLLDHGKVWAKAAKTAGQISGTASATTAEKTSQRVDAVVANINSYTVSYSGTLTLYYQ